jgi:predicted heme/steroid binding protein
MEAMWHLFERAEHDAAEASGGDALRRRPLRAEWFDSLNGTLQASATRRALLLTALGGLLIAGLVTALPIGGGPGRLAGYIDPIPPTGAKGNDAFNRAVSGNCLMWPDRMPEAANIVDCKDEHRFEVSESIDMRTFPGSEYGPSAPPPTATRIEQISQEQCESSVRRYLGAKFDPNSKFVISMLWSGDKAWRQFGERRMLCGLQLPGASNQQVAYKGKVADVDQSKVWPDATCLGIDPATNQPTDIPVDCAAPHAMEVTGTVNLLARFPEGLPPEPEQDGFIKESCTKLTDAYLAPVQLRSTTLTLIYSTLSLPSWSAGHPRQWRLGNPAEQRQGRTEDQRAVSDSAAGHSAGAAEPAADPDRANRAGHSWRRRRLVDRIEWLVECVGIERDVGRIEQPTPGQSAPAGPGAGPASTRARPRGAGSGSTAAPARRTAASPRAGASSSATTGAVAGWPFGWIRNGSTNWCPTRWI